MSETAQCNGEVKQKLLQDIECVLWTATDIESRVIELGLDISGHFASLGCESHQPLVIVGVATGAFMFLADLVRKISIPILLDFIRIQSYGDRTFSSGLATISTDIKLDVRNKHVLVVEDIVDTGITLASLLQHLALKEAASVSVCALLDKVSRRIIPLHLASGAKFFRGFECPDNFVVGYGMDFAERYRNLPYIGILKPAIYT